MTRHPIARVALGMLGALAANVALAQAPDPVAEPVPEASAADLPGLEVMPPDVKEDVDSARGMLLVTMDLSAKINRPEFYSAIDRLLVPDASRPVTICFLDGGTVIRAKVKQAALGWQSPNSSLRLDFGDGAPRQCDPSDRVDVRISFKGAGTWSLIGNEAVATRDPRAATMNFDAFAGWDTMPTPDFQRAVQHEFGHALGLYHEHQNPRASCIDAIDWEAVKRIYPPQRYGSEDYLRQNFIAQLDLGRIDASGFDASSIMLYALDPRIRKANADTSCWLPANMTISATDRAAIAKYFPKSGKRALQDRLKAYATAIATVDSAPITGEQRQASRTILGTLYPFKTQAEQQAYVDSARVALGE